MNKYRTAFKTDLKCSLQRNIFNNMNVQQKRFFGYPENFKHDQVFDNKSIKPTKKTKRDLVPFGNPKGIAKQHNMLLCNGGFTPIAKPQIKDKNTSVIKTPKR